MYQTTPDLSIQNLQLKLGIHYAPPKVRRHGLRETHLWPLVSRGKGPEANIGTWAAVLPARRGIGES